MAAMTMGSLTISQPARMHAQAFTTKKPVRSNCRYVCKASNDQVATPVRPLAGIAAAFLGAAAGLHMFATPAAEAIATQTDMYARPQMSDQKGQKTGQPSQQKPAGQAGAGAVATSGAAEKGGLPDNDLADENSRMQRSTSGSRSANAGKGSNPRFQ